MDFNGVAALLLTVVLFALAIVSSWAFVALFEGAPIWRSRRRADAAQASPNSPARTGVPNNVKVLAWFGYAVAVAMLATPFRESAMTLPLALIALGLPLALRLVPRNWLYGMRSPRTLMTTDDTWYRQNVITGVAFVAVGAIWLLVLVARSVLSN